MIRLKNLPVRMIALLVLALLTALTPYGVAFAINGEYDEDAFSAQDIFYYNPDEGPCTAQTLLTGGENNKDWNDKPVLTETQLSAVADNKKFYEKAVEGTDVPWQVLAAIHYRETGLKKYGPTNGDGPYQIVSEDYPVASTYTDEQFQDASNRAAAFVRNKVGPDLDFDDPNNAKLAFFMYNGTAGAYKEQAKSLGYTGEEADRGEGSPYVMNRADKQRDPTVEPTKSNETWGQIKSDGGPMIYPTNSDYGAFVVYAALAGINVETSTCVSVGALKEGGMTLEEGIAFMETYKTDPEALNLLGGAGRGCSGGPLANCVSFSSYFINKYTTFQGFMSGAPGNGKDVAGNVLARNPEAEGGTVPRPYAIFSRPSASVYGHTGIVLGVDQENNQIIIGEAGCGMRLDWTTARAYNLADYSNGRVTYAYTEGFLNEGLLRGSANNL